MSMPKDDDNMNAWVENDILRRNMCNYVADHPNVSTTELAKAFGKDPEKIRYQVRNLVVAGYIVREGSFVKATYTRTNVPFMAKYTEEDLGLRAGYSRNSTTQDIINGAGLEYSDKDTRTILKVNAHTTIYLNSKKPVAKQAKDGRRKTPPVGIGSSMAMFGNW